MSNKSISRRSFVQRLQYKLQGTPNVSKHLTPSKISKFKSIFSCLILGTAQSNVDINERERETKRNIRKKNTEKQSTKVFISIAMRHIAYQITNLQMTTDIKYETNTNTNIKI